MLYTVIVGDSINRGEPFRGRPGAAFVLAMAAEWAKWFYNSKAWLECSRAYAVSAFYLCERCRKPGYITHHKIELTPENINDPSVTLNWDNLEYLCLDCHNRVNAQSVTRDDVQFDGSGQLIKRCC